MNFEQLISRAEDEVLQQLLGKSVVRLLRLINPALATPSRLRQLLLDLHSPSDLLRDNSARQLLFELLPVNTAKGLLESLQVNFSNNPFEALSGLRFSKGSNLENRLFSFFEEASPVDVHYDIPPNTVQVNANYGLFSHQREAARRVQGILSSERRRVLLHMPTGSGKTRTAMHVIADQLRNNEPSLVIWLAYSEELCEQAATEFNKAWNYLGNREVGLYRFWGARELELTSVHDGFIIAGLSKIYSYANRSIDFIARLADRCSLVIIDEAHQAIAKTYSLVLDVLAEKQVKTGLLGLSATPGRTWNDVDQDQLLADFFYRQKVTLNVRGYQNPIDYLVHEGYLARPNFESLFYEQGDSLSPQDIISIEDSLDIPARLLENLAEDEQRNLLIVKRIEDLVQHHNRIIVFAASVRHANILAAVLRARGIIADSVTGESETLERNRSITRFRGTSSDPIVLCNYGVLTTGFDAPKTSAAIIARPTKSLVLYSQMAGRALRGPRVGGNVEADIITVIDAHIPGFSNPAETFFNWEDVWI